MFELLLKKYKQKIKEVGHQSFKELCSNLKSQGIVCIVLIVWAMHIFRLLILGYRVQPAIEVMIMSIIIFIACKVLEKKKMYQWYKEDTVYWNERQEMVLKLLRDFKVDDVRKNSLLIEEADICRKKGEAKIQNLVKMLSWTKIAGMSIGVGLLGNAMEKLLNPMDMIFVSIYIMGIIVVCNIIGNFLLISVIKPLLNYEFDIDACDQLMHDLRQIKIFEYDPNDNAEE